MDNTDWVMLLIPDEYVYYRQNGFATEEWSGEWGEFIAENAQANIGSIDESEVFREQETIADTLDSGDYYMFNQTGEILFLVKGE